jgi:hypothetical protein
MSARVDNSEWRTQRRFGHSGPVGRLVLPLLLVSLSGLARSPAAASPTAAEIIFRRPPPPSAKPTLKGAPPRLSVRAQPRDLVLAKSPSRTLSIVSKMVPAKSEPVRHVVYKRRYVELAGLGVLIGDYQIFPRLTFSTDNRLDDVNTRERALRDDMDAIEARRRGEIRQDPVSIWLRTRGHSALPGIEPCFQAAFTIQNILLRGIRLPQMLEYGPPPRPIHDDKR